MDLKTNIKKNDELVKDDLPEDDAGYISELEKHGVTEETIPVIVERFHIDNGCAFYDYIKSLSSKKLSSAINSLKKSEYIKNNRTENVYDLLFGLLSILISDSQKYGKHIIRLFDLIIHKINNDGGRLISGGYTKPYISSFVNSIVDKETLPKWEQLKISSKLLTSIIDTFLPPIEKIDNNTSAEIVSKWLNSGRDIIPSLEKKEEKEKRLNRLLKADKEELRDYLDQHDNTVEKKDCEIMQLQTYINELKAAIEKKELEIKSLKSEIDRCEKNIKEEIQKRELAENEVEERKKLNQTQVHYKEMSISSLKSEIGDALRAEYEDFYETINVEMSDMLGEIYKDKLMQIAKILEQKDIKVK